MASNTSLKQRLSTLAIATVAMVWGVAITATYFDARNELYGVLDAHLAQAATLLVAQSSHELEEIGKEYETEYDTEMFKYKYTPRTAFQVWQNGQKLRIHSANSPMQPLSTVGRGFSDSVIDGQGWRVYSSWSDSGEYLIHVAERADSRDDLARTIARNLLLPVLISLPLLAILLWIAVARGLRPLVNLADEVERREPDNLAPLDTSAAPREVLPLIERLNRLFARIDTSIQNERRFTTDAAHELRTPVAAIKAQAQVAQAATDRAQRMHALDNAILGCDRAAHLIDQLLSLSRIDTLVGSVLESCPLRRIAAEVIAEHAPAALEKNVHLELLAGEEVSVPGNPALLRVLLRNLLDNSVKHTVPGTVVRVSVSMEPGGICLSVADDGPGLSEQEHEKVSGRFYRPLGTQASGSGLGLSIVKRIADVHHASLQVAPGSQGRGLRVTVKFMAQ